MIHLRVETQIAAPLARCFDLSRSVDAHVLSASATDERVVAGRTSGMSREVEIVALLPL
ncbi:MAG: hypothetical protein WD045_14550 [Pirellulaceae bacterium]